MTFGKLENMGPPAGLFDGGDIEVEVTFTINKGTSEGLFPDLPRRFSMKPAGPWEPARRVSWPFPDRRWRWAISTMPLGRRSGSPL
jgi:hypothetical protein